MAIFDNGLFSQDDFLQIENVLYSPIEEELIHRELFRINSSWADFAQEIGYDYFKRQGSAKILASGGGAKDIPFVGEGSGGRVTQKVYTVVSGIRFTKAEIAAIAAKRALGKGPSLQLDTHRIDSARRFIREKEAAIAFAGDSEYGILGLFDDSFYGTDLGTKENVAAGATGATTAEKRLWSNKTAQEILTDLETAMNAIESDGLFKARTLVLPPAQYNRLKKPFSETGDSRTLLMWLESTGMYVEKIISSNQLKTTNNGDTVDYFLMIDNSPINVELSLINEISLGKPVEDIVGTQEMAVTLDTAGIIVRHPGALYVGKGI